MIKKIGFLLLFSLFFNSSSYCPVSSYFEQAKIYGTKASANIKKWAPTVSHLSLAPSFNILRTAIARAANNAPDMMTKTVFHKMFLAANLLFDLNRWGLEVRASQKTDKTKVGLARKHLSLLKHLAFKYGVTLFTIRRINDLLIGKVIGISEEPGWVEWYFDPRQRLRLVINVTALLLSVSLGVGLETGFDIVMGALHKGSSEFKQRILRYFRPKTNP